MTKHYRDALTDVAELRRLAEACPKPGSDPHILGPWWDAGDLARIPVDVPADREFIMAASPAAVLGLLDDAAALRAELAHMTEARDNARAEVGRLTAVVEAVRAIHWPQPYADADLRAVSPSLPKEVCAHCRSTGDAAVPWPCPTFRAIGSES